MLRSFFWKVKNSNQFTLNFMENSEGPVDTVKYSDHLIDLKDFDS